MNTQALIPVKHTHQSASLFQSLCRAVGWLQALLLCLLAIMPLSVQAAPATLVKDIFPGPDDSLPGHPIPGFIASIGNTAYFTATDGVSGRELWKSDGSDAGTVLVKDINPGAGDSFIFTSTGADNLINVHGTLFFRATNGTSGYELWKSDGSAAGTVMVKDIRPGSGDSSPEFFTLINGTLYFRAFGPNGLEIWKSDGTETGTVQVKDIRSGTSGSVPFALINVNNTLFFSADDGSSGRELWMSDGTDAGTVMVKDINPGSSGSGTTEITNVNGTLFFNANDGSNGNELWKSDGTAAGTVMVKDTVPTGHFYFQYLTIYNNTLFFSGFDGINGYELWKSDGTDAGTVMVKDMDPGSGSGSPSNLTVVNGTLFFRGYDGVHGAELWTSDGTEAGTVMVKDIKTGSSSGNPLFFINVDGTLYFSAAGTGNEAELWKSDGTTAGTVLAQDINPGTAGSYPRYFTIAGKRMFFQARDASNGAELWVKNFGQPPTAADINPSGNQGVASITVTLSGSDTDGSISTFTLNSLPANGTLYTDSGLTTLAAPATPYAASTNQRELFFVPDPPFSGDTLFTYIATDNDGLDSLPATATITVIPNDAPLLATIGPQTVEEGQLLSLPVSASDDGPLTELDFDAAPLPSGASFIDNGDGTGLFEWTPGAGSASTYNVTFTVTDNDGLGLSDDELVAITVNPPAGGQTPFGGIPWPIPGQVEMEDYDVGGQGIAYNDSTSGNSGGLYRSDDVDIYNTASEGNYVGANKGGEWLEFTVNVAAGGVYNLDLRYATPKSGRQVHVEFNGINVSGPIMLPPTSGWQNWQTLTVPVGLSAGQQIMRIMVDNSGMNLNWVKLTPAVGGNQPPVLNPIGPKSIEEGQLLSFPVSATDDGPATELDYSVSIPSGSSFTDNGDGTGVFNWTPGTGSAGIYPVGIMVADNNGSGLSDFEIVLVTVNPPAGIQLPYHGSPAPIPGQITVRMMSISTTVQRRASIPAPTALANGSSSRSMSPPPVCTSSIYASQRRRITVSCTSTWMVSISRVRSCCPIVAASRTGRPTVCR